jgi:hypothetical protein
MTSSRAIAVWIFDRLGLDVALAGDLLEERTNGRSAIWFWRQVWIAVVAGVWSDILHHKLLALRAVVIGCAVNSVWLFLWVRFLHLGFSTRPELTRPELSIESLASLSLILLTQAVTGWTVARTHRAQAIPMVLVFAIWLAMWFLADSFSEIGRLLMDSLDQPRFRAYLAWYFMPFFTEIAGLLTGGIIGAPGRSEQPADR